MKYIIMIFATAIFLIVGCKYECPLTKEHNIAVDPAVLGVWEPIQDKSDKSQQDERMMILKYSDTEYLIHYPPGGSDEAYYRGYPIKIGGLSCVQLKIIGTDDGPLQKDEKDLFLVASYRLTGDQLEIKTLNTDLVDDNLKTSDELRKGFLKHKDNKELFKDPGVFRKIKK
jgi:hypothetical protein